MPNAKWWWKLSSAVCFRLAPVESDLCMFNIRIDYIRSRQHIFFCFVFARKCASSVVGRQRHRWNKFGGMWTGANDSNEKEKKTRHQQYVRSYRIIPLSSHSIFNSFVLCAVSICPLQLSVRVASSKSRIFPQHHTRRTNDKRQKLKWLTLSSHPNQ